MPNENETENNNIRFNRTGVTLAYGGWIALFITIGATFFDLYEQNNDLENEQLKGKIEELELRINQISNEKIPPIIQKYNELSLSNVQYSSDISYIKTAISDLKDSIKELNRNVQHLNEVEWSAAIKRSINTWANGEGSDAATRNDN